MLSSLNQTLFLVINAAPDTHPLLLNFAMLSSNYLTYLPVIAVIASWCKFPSSREKIVRILLSVGLTLLCANLIRGIVFSPRPFMEHVGTNFLSHNAGNSFPSKHASFVFAIAFSLLINDVASFARSRLNLLLATGALLIALVVSWSRIYLGVHWPKDILAAAALSFLCALFIAKTWRHLKTPMMLFFITLYRVLFYPFIKLGLTKY